MTGLIIVDGQQVEIPAPYGDRTVGTHVAVRVPGMGPGASAGAVKEANPLSKAEA